MTDPIALNKDSIISAALPHIIFEGWTLKTLQNAAKSQGFLPEAAEIYFPDGVIEAIAWHSDMGDRAMVEAIKLLPLHEMKVPQKVKSAVMLRLRQQLPNREAIRKALGILSLPTHYPLSLKLLTATVDKIWITIGDTSNDFNWYTKRFTLAGVYASSLLFWLNDDSEELEDTEAFLNRRLRNVHQFGQTKQKITDLFKSVIPASR